MKTRFATLMATMILITGCGAEKKEAAKSDAADNDSVKSAFLSADISGVSLGGASVTVAGVTFTPPSDWNDMGASGMRKADYSFGPVEGESDSASVAVFYFGAGGGGTVTENINRWIGQMSLPDGGDAATVAVIEKFMVNGMNAHVVEVFGTYSASMGGPMSGKKIAKENYRLAGVVLEGPQGNLFFKLTGPEKTASQMIVGFAAMIKAAK